MNLTVDPDGTIKVARNEEAVTYDPGLAQATAKTQGLAGSVVSSKTTNTNTTNPSTTTTTNTTGENANKTPGSRLGGKNKNYRMLY